MPALAAAGSGSTLHLRPAGRQHGSLKSPYRAPFGGARRYLRGRRTARYVTTTAQRVANNSFCATLNAIDKWTIFLSEPGAMGGAL
jgi:hypothetical protein